jgi:CubicO group peptidase (beta-lactamase class C family)
MNRHGYPWGNSSKEIHVKPSKWYAILFLFLLVYSLVPARVSAQKLSPDFDAVDRYVQAEMQAVGIPGLALAIVHEDEIVYQKGFGIADPTGRPVTPQTPFNIGSVSKTFTALAVMQLVEAGKLELDAPVQRYLPWFRVADSEASTQITVQDLLNHTSGLSNAVGNDYSKQDDSSDSALEQRVRALSDVQLNRPVGSGHEYSNANYDVLGLIVQVVSGQSYETYIQQNIFEPLEMSNSFSLQDEARQHGLATGYRMWFGFPIPYRELAPRAHIPSGQQFSSVEDLAHLLIAHLNGGNYQGSSILSAAGIESMQNTPVSSGANCATYSMHWSHGSRCDTSTLGMGGDTANFKARILLSPEEKWAVILLMNAQAVGINGPRQERIKDGVLDLLHEETPISSAPHNIQITASMVFIAVVTVIFLISMLRSIARLRRQSDSRSDTSHKVGRRIILPLVFDILWVLLLAGMVQFAASSRSSSPLSFMLENIPDLGWMIVLSASFVLGWGLLRTILIPMKVSRD